MSDTEHDFRLSDRMLFARIWPFIKPYKRYYLVALACAPLAAGITVLQPLLLKIGLDDYILKGNVDGVQWVALAYLGAALASWLVEAVYLLVLSHGAMRTITLLRTRVYEHTLGLGRSFFDRQPTGRLMTRVTSDVEALGETLTAGSVTIVLDVLKVIGILIAMVAIDVWLTGVLLLMAPLIALIVEGIRRVLRKLYLEVRTSLSELNAFTAERLNGLAVIQLYCDESRAVSMYRERLNRYRSAAIQTNVYDAALYAIMNGLRAVAMALMLWYGSGGLLESAVTAGLLAAFIDYVDKLFQPVQEFSAKVAIIQRATTAMQKIFGLLEVDERIEPGQIELSREPRTIAFRDVSFSYGTGPEVLRGLSLVVKQGEVVAVVGRTGSGKTTLGRMLTRDYQPYSGSILIGDHELRDVELTALRSIVGAVHQDVFLYSGTVRFNIALGRPMADERILEVIALARAEETVARLGGLDGLVTHKGGNLSAGERQLIAFARVLAYEAPMVILDEATANVDSLTEARIQEATQEILAQKTVLVIAHRLSTIVHADRIAVMDAGVVVEQGSHRELMQRNARYADLFRKQFAEQETKPDRLDGRGLTK